MKPFVIRQHDLLEPLTVTAYYENNTDVDLSSGLTSLRFRFASRSGLFIFERDAVLISPKRFRYNWQAGDTAIAGHYNGVFIATFTDGLRPLTFPTRGFIPITIAEQLPDE